MKRTQEQLDSKVWKIEFPQFKSWFTMPSLLEALVLIIGDNKMLNFFNGKLGGSALARPAASTPQSWRAASGSVRTTAQLALRRGISTT